MSKFRKFFTGAAAFTLLTIITKLIGALYRIPLTNIVGAEGIGLYQMVFPLYTVLLTITSGGVTTAMAKYVATLEAKRTHDSAQKALGTVMGVILVSGGIAATFVILFCRRIADIQGNEDVALPYLGIAPALLFVAVVACFRGYFQGKQNLFPTALSQLIEQVIKLASGLWLASIFVQKSTKMAVFGATLGVSISEIVAMIVLILFYFGSKAMIGRRQRINVKKLTDSEFSAELAISDKITAVPGKKEILTSIYKTAIPSAMGSLVLPLTQLMDSVLIVNVLVGMGLSDTKATALFGIINGPINSLINLPIVVTLAVSIAILPKIAAFIAEGKDPADIVMKALKVSSLLAIPCVAIFVFFPSRVLGLLYSGGLDSTQLQLAAILLRVSAITVFYVSMLQVATSVLQAVGKAHVPALNLLAGAAVKIACTLLLLIKIGIVGAVIASVLCYIVTSTLDFYRMRKLGLKRQGFYGMICVPIIASAIMVGALFASEALLSALPQKAVTILSLAIGAVVYIIFVFILGGIKKEELKELLGL